MRARLASTEPIVGRRRRTVLCEASEDLASICTFQLRTRLIESDIGMDASDLAKHLSEAASVAKVAAASIPFTAVVKRMVGPAADQLAGCGEIKFGCFGTSDN